MSTSVIATIILLGVFLGLLILRVPVIYAVGAAALSTILYLGIDLMTMASIMIKTINTYSLLCIPLFILMGEVMSAGGISQRLIGLADALVGWMRGGLAMANCVASLFFGGISGSSAADTASLGPILIPMMTKQGYDKDFSTCVTRCELSRTFSSNLRRSHILRTSSRSRRLILSPIVSFAVWLKWTRTI